MRKLSQKTAKVSCISCAFTLKVPIKLLKTCLYSSILIHFLFTSHLLSHSFSSIAFYAWLFLKELIILYPNSISVLSPIFKLRLNPLTDASLPISELSSTTSKRLVYEPIMLSRTIDWVIFVFAPIAT